MMKHKLKFRSIPLLLGLAAICLCHPSYGQERTDSTKLSITGTVVASGDNTPLPGASVVVKKTMRGTTCDAKGRFSLSGISPDAVLEVSFIGYNKQEVAVNGKTSLLISLTPEAKKVDDVVVIGYGSVAKRDLTGSVGSVDMERLVKAPVASFTDALAGRIAGVLVSSSDGQPGDVNRIVIRGGNSLTQDNTPLFVVDGFPMEAEDFVLPPDEIESITILKDASSTAIYGARGANGVIVVETKKGKIGKPVVTYNGYAGFQLPTKKMDMLDPYEFLKFHSELSPQTVESKYFTDGRTLESYRNVDGYDWQDMVTRTAFTQSHTVSISGGKGGDRGTRYSLSGSYYGQDGIIINSDYSRAQGRVFLEQNLNPKVTVGLRANYGTTKTGGQPVAVGESNSATSVFYYSVWGYRPVVGNNFDIENEFADPDAQDFMANPVRNVRNTFMQTKRNDLLATAYLNYKILPGLTLKISGSFKNQMKRTDRFYNSLTSRGSSSNPNNVRGVNGSVQHQELNTWLNENTLNYTKLIKRHHMIEAIAGFSMQHQKLERYGFAAMNVPNEALGISGLDEGTPYENTALRSTSGLMSFFGRFNYNYKRRYYATISFRADGSSKFAPANKWGYFPSGAVAWTISNEPFMKNVRFINTLKLRASYGSMGNNRVGDFSYMQSVHLNTYEGYSFNNTTPHPILTPNNIGNKDLKWETTREADLGLDIEVLNNRISFTADIYRKTTRDLLLNASIPYTTGYSTVYDNIGSVRNDGLELTLNTLNIDKKDFQWRSSFNISFNRHKILSLSNNETSRTSALAWEYAYRETPLYIAQVGKPAALFFGYVFDGIYQLDDFTETAPGQYSLKNDIPDNGNSRNQIQPGDIKLKDLNGDGKVDSNDQTIIGNPQPLHTGGFSNTFTYKGLSLDIFFQWSYGNDVYNANRIIFEGERPRNLLNQFASVKDRWSPTNPSNTIPRAGGQAPVGTYSSRVVEDGSFLRLKTIALSYTIPQKFTKKIGIQNLTVNASAQNIYTWTNYSGMDPEVSVRYSVLTPGFDYAPYPRALTLVFGLKMTF